MTAQQAAEDSHFIDIHVDGINTDIEKHLNAALGKSGKVIVEGYWNLAIRQYALRTLKLQDNYKSKQTFFFLFASYLVIQENRASSSVNARLAEVLASLLGVRERYDEYKAKRPNFCDNSLGCVWARLVAKPEGNPLVEAISQAMPKMTAQECEAIYLHKQNIAHKKNEIAADLFCGLGRNFAIGEAAASESLPIGLKMVQKS